MRRRGRRVTVRTKAENPWALAFYWRTGFIEVGTGPEKIGKVEAQLTWLIKEL